MKVKDVFFLVLMFALCGCYQPNSPAYNALYAHLERPCDHPEATWTSDHFLVIYVNARHLDYTDNNSFLSTVAKHPSDGSRSRDFGHAWIYLRGISEKGIVCFYGGHSGERGLHQAKYFDGIMNYIDYGYANPSAEQLCHPRYEANPVKYLWEVQKDGYFEKGSGGHHPTFAAKVDLTHEQFQKILDFVQNYDYPNYSLTGNQCSSFVAQAASLGGLDLESEATISLKNEICFKGEWIRFWEDPFYSQLTISSPDIIERSLMEAICLGKAERVNCGVR